MRAERVTFAAPFVLSLALLIVFLPAALAASPFGREFIPPEHWSYDALRRFEALGFVVLPMTAPFTRPEIAAYVDRIETAVDSAGAELSGRDRFNLDRLRDEFAAPASIEDPTARYDPPVLYAAEAPLRLEGDIDVSVAPEKRLFDPRWWIFGVSNVSAKLHFGDWVTYEVRYRLTVGPERDEWAHKMKPSPREKSWHGVTGLFERSYLVFQWKPVVLYWGRDYENWGPSTSDNLHLSRTAESFDKIGGRVSFRNFRLILFHSYLSVVEPRRTLSGHRLEMDAGGFTFGLTETALYTGRGIDPVYWLPLSAFYSNQFNERGDDNIIWSVDAKYRAGAGTLLHGALLIDDYQFEDRGENPDKLGFDLGARIALGGPLPMTADLRYRRVGIYTYTHRDSLKYHVAMEGDPAAGDPPLGTPLGPDADIADVRVECYPHPRFTTAVFASYLRRGEGDDYRAHTPELDPVPPFPSGVIERSTAAGIALLWELDGGSAAGIDAARVWVGNREHVQGRDEDDTVVRAFFTWDF